MTKAARERWIYRVDWTVEDDCTLDEENRYERMFFAVTMSVKVVMARAHQTTRVTAVAAA